MCSICDQCPPDHCQTRDQDTGPNEVHHQGWGLQHFQECSGTPTNKHTNDQCFYFSLQIISSVKKDQVIDLVAKYGERMKNILIYDRVAQGIQDFCANNSIDEVYNSRFVELSQSVESSLNSSIGRLSSNGLVILNLFIPKPDIPPAIAANYREVQ